MSLSAPAIAKGTTEQLHSTPKVPKCLPPRGPSGLGGSHASGFLSERQLLENRSSVKGVHKFHEWLEASRRASPPVVEPVVPTARLCRKSTAGSLSLSPSLPDLINLRHEDSDQESESSRPMSFSECARSSAVPRASAFSHRRFRSLDRVVGTDSASNSASATWSGKAAPCELPLGAWLIRDPKPIIVPRCSKSCQSEGQNELARTAKWCARLKTDRRRCSCLPASVCRAVATCAPLLAWLFRKPWKATQSSTTAGTLWCTNCRFRASFT